MLKSILIIQKKINIGNYNQLEAFLKQRSKGYIPKKSKILTREDVLKFFTEAPTDLYLLEKVLVTLFESFLFLLMRVFL